MSESDEVLITLYLEGSSDALRILIGRYTDSIYNYVKRLGGNAQSTDIVQEVFIAVWKQLKNFDPKKALFKTWLFRIARNKTIDFLRKKQHLVFSEMDQPEEELNFEETLADSQLLPDELLQKSFDTDAFQKIFDTLPENYKTVLILHYENEMTFEAIGEILNKPLNTVKSWHRRTIMLLRQKLHQNPFE